MNSGKQLLTIVYRFLRSLVHLEDSTDQELTIATITNSVEFKGVNIWILFLAIIVASVGLDTNSTAVIIGAMLISPLMGPINGIGLAVGIIDDDLLKKSIYNLILMVSISLIASTTYFILSPIANAQSELLARTQPTIFDVFIAFFGGMAGIVATSRKSQPFTVISGVAIATALMPPLCTAGFGIAHLSIKMFFGAFYLFFINSFFIALATYLMVRYLKFPTKKFADKNRRKFVKRFIIIFAVVIIVPSLFMAVRMIKEIRFNAQATKYLSAIQTDPIFNSSSMVSQTCKYDKKEPFIEISVVGAEIDSLQLVGLQNRLVDFGISHTHLKIRQIWGVKETYQNHDAMFELIEKKDLQIVELQQIIDSLNITLKQQSHQIEIDIQIAKELAVSYPNIETFSFTMHHFIAPKTLDMEVAYIFSVKWYEEPVATEKEHLEKWLQVRLELPELRVENIN